jgi:hypothetical protein
MASPGMRFLNIWVFSYLVVVISKKNEYSTVGQGLKLAPYASKFESGSCYRVKWNGSITKFTCNQRTKCLRQGKKR